MKQKLLTRIKNVVFDIRFTPVILLLLCVISYGLFLPVMGFFVDDWYFMWFQHIGGILQIPAIYSTTRPFQGSFYPVASFLLAGSESPFIWGLFAIILRWLCTLALWGMLKTLWPKSDPQNRFVVLLAAVFPGFTQHWIVIQISYFYVCLAFFFLSITFMIKAVREPKRFWIYYPISFLLGFYSMASEYYYGLELIRPVILWIVFSRENPSFGKRVKEILKYWSAFLVSFIGFAIWRVFFFASVTHSLTNTDAIMKNPLNTILSTLRVLYQSIVDTVINSWINPFNLSNYPEKGIVSVLIPIIVGVIFISLCIWLYRSSKGRKLEEQEDFSSWRREAILLSISSLVFAILPFWASNLPITYLKPFNRFLLAYILGSCLMVVIIFDSVSSWIKKEIFIIALLVAVASGYQINNSNLYRYMWIRQRDFYWQLIWRIPGLRPGTTLFFNNGPLTEELWNGNAITAQINWTYSGMLVNHSIDYYFVSLDTGLRQYIQSLYPNIPFQIDLMNYHFEGNTSKSIYVSLPDPGCVRILDQNLTPPQTVITNLAINPSKGDMLSGSALTDLNLILNDGISQNHPPLQILGSEIPHTWCYYFEKADLARQFGDYKKAISLLREAKAEGFSPGVGSEWYPFIDAYARSGDWENAELITKILADDTSPTIHLGLCNLWQKLADDFTDTVASETSGEIITTVLTCEK